MLICAWGVQHVPLDIHYLAWSLRAEWLHILEIELLMLLPFLLAGGFLGLVLMDRSERIHGHYAANLIGSGAGAVLSIVLMSYVSTSGLVILLAALACGAGAALTNWKRPEGALAGTLIGILYLAAAVFFPSEIRISPYKKLALEKSKTQTEIVATATGPLGRIDVVRGPSIHDAPPGMSLQNPHPIPPRTLVIVDGDQTHIVYHAANRQDWRFLDYTTAAVAWVLNDPARVLVLGPGGGAPLALAYLKGSREIDALAANRRMIDLIRSRLAQTGGDIYRISNARLYFEAPRGWLRRTGRSYDLILVPMLDSAGASAGLQATQENYLYTVQSLRSFIRHLNPDGMLSVTVRAKTPPRDGLRIFNTAVAALEQENLSAPDRLALIRSWETVTLLVRKTPWTDRQLQRIQAFGRSRGFDLGYLPGLKPEAANRFHVLPRPYYYEGTRALLGADRQAYIRDYLFALDAPTDDRPYFNHFIRWRRLPELQRRLGGRMPAFVELGSLLMVTALVQVAALAGVLIFSAASAAADGAQKGARQRPGHALFLFAGNRLHAARDGLYAEADSVSRPSDIFGGGGHRGVSRICRRRKPFKRTLGSPGIFRSTRGGLRGGGVGMLISALAGPLAGLDPKLGPGAAVCRSSPDHRAIGPGHGAFISDGTAPGQRGGCRPGALVLGGQRFCLGARNRRRALAGHVHRVFKIDPGGAGLLFGRGGALWPVAAAAAGTLPLKAAMQNSHDTYSPIRSDFCSVECQ